MNDFLTWLKHLAETMPDAIAHPVHQWHRDNLTTDMLRDIIRYNHEEKMEIIRLLQICEQNGSITPEQRLIYMHLLSSSHYELPHQLFLE